MTPTTTTTGLRSTYDPGTKYNCHMAAYVYGLILDGDTGDDEVSDGMGFTAARFGRRIITENDQGFVDLQAFDTVADAEEYLATLAADITWEESEDDFDELDGHVDEPHPFLEEVRAAERLAGTE